MKARTHYVWSELFNGELKIRVRTVPHLDTNRRAISMTVSKRLWTSTDYEELATEIMYIANSMKFPVGKEVAQCALEFAECLLENDDPDA